MRQKGTEVLQETEKDMEVLFMTGKWFEYFPCINEETKQCDDYKE